MFRFEKILSHFFMISEMKLIFRNVKYFEGGTLKFSHLVNETIFPILEGICLKCLMKDCKEIQLEGH